MADYKVPQPNMPTAELPGHFAITRGELAYLDTFAGLVPCKVTTVDDDGNITIRLTATRGAYRRGEIIAGRRANSHVVTRTQVVTRSGVLHIVGKAYAYPDTVLDAPAGSPRIYCSDYVRLGTES